MRGHALLLLLALLLLALLLATAPVTAQEGSLSNRGAGRIIIWRSEAAGRDGRRLINAGQVDLVKRDQIACIVAEGTRVVKLAGGYATNRVTVISGPNLRMRGLRVCGLSVATAG